MYRFVDRRTKIAAFFVDLTGFVLWALCHILTPWKIISRKTIPANPERILLIRADYIGDVLLTTHTLEAIRERFRSAHITYLVSSKSREILEGNPYLDRIVTYDPPWYFKKGLRTALSEYLEMIAFIRGERFALAADFGGDVRNIFLLMVLGKIPHRVSFASSGGWFLLTNVAPCPPLIHESAYNTIVARSLGASVGAEALPEMFVGEKETVFARTFLDRNNVDADDTVAVIHQGARLPLKQWPLERYAEAGRHIISRHHGKVILTGTDEEIPAVERLRDLIGHGDSVITAAGATRSLKELKALFGMCDLFIGTSSGPSHVAACAGLPSVIISGPESAVQWRPLGNRCILLKQAYPCCPCNERRCPYLEKGKNCILAIEAEDVKEAADKILNS